MAYLLLFASIFFSTCGQIFQKLGAGKITQNMKSGKSLMKNIFEPYVILGILSLGLGAFTWLIVLSKMELSLAYPMLSLGYVLVTGVSKFLFKEEIPRSRWLGVIVIMIGIALISQT